MKQTTEKVEKKKYGFRIRPEVNELIETHKYMNDDDRSAFVTEAVRRYCADIDGEKNCDILVDRITSNVRAMTRNDVNRIYELWYQAKCAVYGTYTDNPPPRKPLSQEEAFKPIRNAMIKEADELGKILLTLDNDQEEQSENTPNDNDDDNSSKDGSSSHTTNNTGSNSQSTNTAQPKNHSNYTAARNGYIATSITRFGNSLSRIFRERFDEQAKHAPMGVDSRLKREIEAKKKGQNISM